MNTNIVCRETKWEKPQKYEPQTSEFFQVLFRVEMNTPNFKKMARGCGSASLKRKDSLHLLSKNH